MTTFQKLCQIEKSLICHLLLGGTASDEVGRKMIAICISCALEDSRIHTNMIANDLSPQDFCEIYRTSIESLMPNPCIIAGDLLLAPTLLFIEPVRLEELLGLLRAENTDRIGSINDETVTWYVGEIHNFHKQMNGEADFEAFGYTRMVEEMIAKTNMSKPELSAHLVATVQNLKDTGKLNTTSTSTTTGGCMQCLVTAGLFFNFLYYLLIEGV